MRVINQSDFSFLLSLSFFFGSHGFKRDNRCRIIACLALSEPPEEEEEEGEVVPRRFLLLSELDDEELPPAVDFVLRFGVVCFGTLPINVCKFGSLIFGPSDKEDFPPVV